MTRKRKPWSETATAELPGVKVLVRVYERSPGSLLYRETRDAAGAKDRKSLGHRDRAKALEQAKELAWSIAELRRSGPVIAPTLGELLRLYSLHRAPSLSAKRRALAESMYRPYFLAHLGEAFQLENLSQTHIDAYVVARRARTIVSKRHRGVSTAPRDGTIRNELNWLKSVIRWARGYRIGGKPILATDPLAGIHLLRERNVKRPIASEARYQQTMKVAERTDPSGRLACMLALARFTGRRINAICQLRANDVYLTRDQVLRALAAAGLDERQADYMPHGSIAWREDFDKLGYFELTALSKGARAAVDQYLRKSPRLGSAPLFPDRRKPGPEVPVSRAGADHLLRHAEDVAELPKLERGLWHCYRRLYASERKHLPDVDVAKSAGWRDLSTMKRSYQQPDPATVLKVIENEPPAATDKSSEGRASSQ